ncbi:MAG: glutamate racemase [Clostridia bacterium]|nr:glutamate racemase [Clostridia bacterium]
MIGIFDSGLGGLSALKEVRRLLPFEDIVYFGDTGRVPYGTRSRETIIKYSLQDMHFLASHNIDAVLVACGTVSSNALVILREKYPSIPIIGVIDAGVRAAAKATRNKIIGIAGTPSTIGSGAFDTGLRAISPDFKIISSACPLFVPLVENGFVSKDEEITRLAAEIHLQPIIEAGADTLILGCTHYPIIAPSIAKVIPNASLINVGAAAAEELRDIITARGMHDTEREGAVKYYVSDEPQGFERIASIFLGEEITDKVTRIDIEKY